MTNIANRLTFVQNKKNKKIKKMKNKKNIAIVVIALIFFAIFAFANFPYNVIMEFIKTVVMGGGILFIFGLVILLVISILFKLFDVFFE